MKQSKFEKKAEKAKLGKLCKMFVSNLEYDATKKETEKLQYLSDKIPDHVEDKILFSYYENVVDVINNERYKMLTGYGQCRGHLVSYKGNIIFCCCQDLALLIAYRNAHTDCGKLCIPGTVGSASRFKDSVYVVNDDESMTFDTCPFCGAVIQERADFDDTGKED